MPERVILTIGTKKGLFVAQAPKSRRSFASMGRSDQAWPCTPLSSTRAEHLASTLRAVIPSSA